MAHFVDGPLDGEQRELEQALPVFRVAQSPGTFAVDAGDVDELLELPPPLEYRRDVEPFRVVGGNEWETRHYRYRLEASS